MDHCKAEYAAEPQQQELQQRDFNEGGNGRRRSGMRSRWSREQQRRCGCKLMWELVSFVGSWDHKFLEEAAAASPQRDDVGASQPDVEERQRLRWEALKAREMLRYGARLNRRRQAGKPLPNREAERILREFDNGTLRRQCNEATRRSGHGRLRGPDGTIYDIGGSTGGACRAVLDHVYAGRAENFTFD